MPTFFSAMNFSGLAFSSLIRVSKAGKGWAPETKRPREVLVVASKLKEYVRLRAGFNTSDRALEALSDVVRERCASGAGRDPATRNADIGFRCCSGPANGAEVDLSPVRRPVLEKDASVSGSFSADLLRAMQPDHRSIEGVDLSFDQVWRWHPRDNEELVVARWVGRPKKGKAFYELAVFKLCGNAPTRVAHMRSAASQREQMQGARIRLTVVIAGEDLAEHRIRTRHRGEERHRGAQLEHVRKTEDLLGGAPAQREQGLRAFAQAHAQHRMCEVGARFIHATDAVVLRARADAEPGQLREYEPHPMTALAPRAQLGQRIRMDPALRLDEALQAIGIFRNQRHCSCPDCACTTHCSGPH